MLSPPAVTRPFAASDTMGLSALNQAHQVQRAGKAALDLREGLLPRGRVAAQRQDVADACLLGLRPRQCVLLRIAAGLAPANKPQASAAQETLPLPIDSTPPPTPLFSAPPPLTLTSASLSFSTGMLVQVRCIIVSIPTCAGRQAGTPRGRCDALCTGGCRGPCAAEYAQRLPQPPLRRRQARSNRQRACPSRRTSVCIRLAMSSVRSAVEPPAPQVISQNVGPSPNILCCLSTRFCTPSSVLGGKYCKGGMGVVPTTCGLQLGAVRGAEQVGKEAQAPIGQGTGWEGLAGRHGSPQRSRTAPRPLSSG